MKFGSLFLLSAVSITAAMAKEAFETNQVSSSYSKCDNQDLAVLNHCAREVLKKLDQCGPDDLACECCALQSLKHLCYDVCSDSFSSNFLNVMYEDCEPFKEVNACSLQFKKNDYTTTRLPKKNKNKKKPFVNMVNSNILSANRSESANSFTSKIPLINEEFQRHASKNGSRDSTSRGPKVAVKDGSRDSSSDKILQNAVLNHTNTSNTTIRKQDMSSSVRILPKLLALTFGTLVSIIAV